EQAAADVAALEIGDAQRRRARRLLRVVDRLPQDGQGPRRGARRNATGGQERTTTVARLHDDASLRRTRPALFDLEDEDTTAGFPHWRRVRRAGTHARD